MVYFFYIFRFVQWQHLYVCVVGLEKINLDYRLRHKMYLIFYIQKGDRSDIHVILLTTKVDYAYSLSPVGQFI
jgi:hypothetical protein